MNEGKFYYTVHRRSEEVLVQAFKEGKDYPNYLDATARGTSVGQAIRGIEKVMERHIKQRQARLDRLQEEINDMKGWLAAKPLEERER